MKVKMIKSERGSQDGLLIQNFKEGEIYDIVSDLASVFVDVLKVAEYTLEEPIEQKAMGSAPENKMADVEQTENKEEEIEFKPKGRK
jgi:hypothetical protein